MANVNIELQKERSKCTFNTTNLNLILNDNDKKTIEIDKLIKNEFEKDHLLNSPIEHYFLSREEQFKRSIIISSKIVQIKKKLGLMEEATLQIYRNLCHDYPFLLHDIVFTGAIKSLASDDQLKELLPKILNYKMFGSYGQTELAHGSNVQGIETTSRYIKSSDEFEINTPSTSAVKWWIGGLGKIATHCIVFAQLYTSEDSNHSYGPHPFLVQVRSLEDHKPLPGVTIGDIGPKFGFNCVDNGYLKLDKIRIPRSQMLERFSRVTRSGEYIKPTHSRLIYAGMVGVRVHLVKDSFYALARACTIASRYSVIRRQFKMPGQSQENQVLDYPNQLFRIVPYIAKAFAYIFTGFRMERKFQKVLHDVKVHNNTDELAELHSNSSGLKSVMTYGTTEGIESCRLACGGHGYSLVSGFPTLLSNYVHVVTAEGENNILPQQTTRFLLKTFQQIVETNGEVANLGDSLRYLQDQFKSNENNQKDGYQRSTEGQSCFNSNNTPKILLDMFAHRSYFQLKNLSERIQELLTVEGNNLMNIWSDLNIDCLRISKAHCQYHIIESFYLQLQSLSTQSEPKVEKEILKVLDLLFKIYSLFLLDQNLSDFLHDSYLRPTDINLIRSELLLLLKQIRPNIIGIIDSFGLSDFTLGSAIGNYDGRVYENLFEIAQNQPFNRNQPVVNGYNEYLKPLLKSNL